MKTQISKDGYRRENRYSGVYQQQGRLITDSDWNELVDTMKSRVDEALTDIVGTGSPKGNAATIQMSGTTPKLVAGTVYAGGLEGRLAPVPGSSFPFDLTQQADFPSPTPLPPANTAYRLYADVWDRTVGALEDDRLRDPALHGADTCTRTQRMVQVKWAPTIKNPGQTEDNPSQGDARLTVKYPSAGGPVGSDACDPQAQQVDPVGGDYLFRVEIHDVRWPANVSVTAPDRVVVKWSRENGAEQYAFADMPDWFEAGPWIYELYDVISEKHLGFHLASSPGWAPKRGSLVTALPPTAPAGTLVRRWDGYVVLVRSGSVWSVSAANGETAQDTAGGATVQLSDGALKVTLTDLELSLTVQGRVLVPGDFWTTAVRRATYEAGLELLRTALPSGIVHRYVHLADVLANGQLRIRTAAEQRKLAFPKLTELDAGDMGYVTNCSSGLYDATHDTVQKALDRLCALDGAHVKYIKPSDTSVYKGNNPGTVKQALDLLADVQSDDIGYVTSCSSGLYDGTHNTVKKALDRLCAINATHVGFTKPADTSVFQGSNPTTVAGALGLLADVKSQQISYSPVSNPAVHEVKAALDELYARPVQNGTRVYVGDGGQYATLDLAVGTLLAQGKKDIAIALMPGTHKLAANWHPGDLTGVRLNILGLGAAAFLDTKTVFFTAAESIQIQQVHWLISGNNTVTFDTCGEVILTGNFIEGDRLVNKALIILTEARRVVIQDNVIDSQGETTDGFVVNVLGFNAFENITELFSVGLTEFRIRALQLGQTLNNLPQATRNNLAAGITSRLATNQLMLNVDENVAYQQISFQLQGDASPAMPGLYARTLEQLRHVTYVKNPGTSILFSIFTGPTIIQGNQIVGLIGLVNLPKNGTNLLGKEAGFMTNGQLGRVNYPNARHVMQVTGNLMAGIRGGESLINALTTVTTGSFFSFSGPFKVVSFTDNVIENDDNLFIGEEVNLQGNNFTAPAPPLNQAAFLPVAWVMAANGVYFNNRGRAGAGSVGSRLFNGVNTSAASLAFANNFRLLISSS